MEEDVRKNILERHYKLKRLGKVTEAVSVSGYSHKTYTRALDGQKCVKATTMMAILRAQAKVLEVTDTKLQLA